jgi:hypothetical protein
VVYKQREKNACVLPASCEKVEGLVQVKVEVTVEMTADKLVYAFLQQYGNFSYNKGKINSETSEFQNGIFKKNNECENGGVQKFV